MEINVEKLTDTAQHTVQNMDKDDLLALKLCLLSTGILGGLALKGKFARRLAGTACAFLSAGLALPLVTKYLDELKEAGEPLVDLKVEKGEAPDAETLFEFKVEAGVDDEPEAPKAPEPPDPDAPQA